MKIGYVKRKYITVSKSITLVFKATPVGFFCYFSKQKGLQMKSKHVMAYHLTSNCIPSDNILEKVIITGNCLSTGYILVVNDLKNQDFELTL